MKLCFRSITFASVAFSLAACSANSEDVKTSGLQAHYVVSTQGTAKPVAEASYSLASGEFRAISLNGGDYVTCNGTALKERGESTVYAASIEQKTDYEFVFSRPNEPKDARRVSHPVTFSLAPSGALAGAYTDSFTVKWDAPLATAEVTITADRDASSPSSCPPTVNLEFLSPDKGSATFSAAKFAPEDGSKTACKFNVTVQRDLVTAIGVSPFDGGSLASRHIETIPIELHP